MDALPIRPQGPHHPPHRAAHTRRRRRAAAAAHAPRARCTARGARSGGTGDARRISRRSPSKRTFDAVASARAEQQREMNVLRDLAMQQVKRDDQTMNAWIKLI